MYILIYWTIIMLCALAGAKLKAQIASDLMLKSIAVLYFTVWGFPFWRTVSVRVFAAYEGYIEFGAILTGAIAVLVFTLIVSALIRECLPQAEFYSGNHENLNAAGGAVCGIVSGFMLAGLLMVAVTLYPVERKSRPAADLAKTTVMALSRTVNGFASDTENWNQQQASYLDELLAVPEEPAAVEPVDTGEITRPLPHRRKEQRENSVSQADFPGSVPDSSEPGKQE